MKTTYSWKRITDQQIEYVYHIPSSASLLAKLMTVTDYPVEKCLLALEHARRRGLIEATDGQPMLVPGRIRTPTATR